MAERRRRSKPRGRGQSASDGGSDGRSKDGSNARSAGSARLVFGLHAVTAVVDRRPSAIRAAWVQTGATSAGLAALVKRLKALNVSINSVARNELDQRTEHGTHQGIVLEVHRLKELSLSDFEDLVMAKADDLRLLILDQVADPRNLGACLRTADAAGVDAVVVPKDRSAGLSSSAVKAAAGAAETVPIVTVTNLARTLRWLQEAGVTIYGADADSDASLYKLDISAPFAIVLGSEGSGLRRLTRESCNQLFRVPMAGTVESLNVSVTAGIVLFEALRQSSLSS